MNADIGTVLTHVLVVLVAAKAAAEIAERVGVPAVVGEILAGIAVGPSMLDFVGGGDDVLRTLGEIGVILLLLDVGLEMDLGELGAVGRTSLLVATVGVVSPLLLGLGAMELIGGDFKTSLFVGAALTATSVGITARVFGDLRALATTEARIVLGAAVADDVMGLVVLTVVVRLVTEGSVSVLSVGGIIAVALGFLVVGIVVGLRVAPALFSAVERRSRSTGTLVAIALAFTLGFAELADRAKLAPIVGAFVAGLALARARPADRIRRELAPVGHLFIPVFFLQIGIDANVESFARGGVLRDAGILLAVAVVGKLVSPLGALGGKGDKVLIGLGMLPRGEVGLIFATIGLQTGVLDGDLYASLLLVVLATTLVTPPLLRWRMDRVRAGATRAPRRASAPMPEGGWLRVERGEVLLAATPPDHLGLTVALEAASLVASARPSAELLDWLSGLPTVPWRWDKRATEAFLRLLTGGNARSWRFLDTIGVLERALPELAQTLHSRQADPFQLDPMATHRWTAIERLQEVDEADPLVTDLRALAHPEWLRLGALLAEGLDEGPRAVATARQIVRRLDLGAAAEQEIAILVGDRDLLWSVARHPDGLREESVLQVASHLDRPEIARALYLLSVALGRDQERWEVERLAELHALVQKVLANPELTGLDARNLVGRRRAEAVRVAGAEPDVVARIEAAPRAYVLAVDGATIARHAALLEPLPSDGEARAGVEQGDTGWWVDVASRDRPGYMAAVSRALAELDLDVERALVATWDDGGAIESFLVDARVAPDRHAVRVAVERALDEPLDSEPLPGAAVTFDDGASPWHTMCEVRAPDKPGLLHALATAFAAAGVNVHSADIRAAGDLAVDRFALTDRDGHKLTEERKAAVMAFVAGGVRSRRRRLARWRRSPPPARVADPSLVP